MEGDRFITRKELLSTLKVSHNTVYAMVQRGELEVVKAGRHNMYNLDKFLRNQGIKKENQKINICYCRVSSRKQEEDLSRQVEMMENLYPDYQIVQDVGSGLNMKRKGLMKIINLAIAGQIGNLVVAFKDRLARFGFELIEEIIVKYSDGKITVLNNKEEKTPLEEITEDILSIMNIYTAKINGLRKYKKAIQKEIEDEMVSK